MKITVEMLVAKSACAEGMSWVRKHLPEGAEYKEFIQSLESAKHPDWADWLINQFGVEVLAEKWRIDEILQKAKGKLNDEGGNYAQIGSSGNSAQIGSSGDSAKIGSSGDSAQIGSSGNDAQIGSSGDDAQIGSSGDYAQIGSSGDFAQIGSSGDSAQIGSSGNFAKIEAKGKTSIVAAVGPESQASAGENGCLALSWWDGKRYRMVVGYVGEDFIKSNVLYKAVNG